MIFTEKYHLCDHSVIGDAFIGANSASGFVGALDKLVNEESMNRVYVIKGAAGTGKSTLLKKLCALANESNINAERYACSSDPNSLDLVVINSEVAVLDGTAPHTYDMHLPGAASSLIDLSVFWDSLKLREYKEDIVKLTKQKKASYNEVYAKLKILDMLFSERMKLIKQSINTDKLEKYVNKLIKDVGLFKCSGNGVIQYHRCISTQGRLRLDTLQHKAKYILKIEDYYGSGYVITEMLAEQLRKNSICHIASVDPLNSSIISDVYLPSEKVLITVEDVINADKVINMKRFVLNDALSDVKGEIRLSVKCAEAIDAEMLKHLSNAGKAHRELELIYSACMDFEGLGKFTNDLCCDIIRSISR